MRLKDMKHVMKEMLMNDKSILMQINFIFGGVFKRFVVGRGSHQELGLLGVAGCKTLPPNGIWWESGERMGKVIEYRGNAYHPLDFEHGDEDRLCLLNRISA